MPQLEDAQRTVSEVLRQLVGATEGPSPGCRGQPGPDFLLHLFLSRGLIWWLEHQDTPTSGGRGWTLRLSQQLREEAGDPARAERTRGT